jgi:hypothetical protein
MGTALFPRVTSGVAIINRDELNKYHFSLVCDLRYKYASIVSHGFLVTNIIRPYWWLDLKCVMRLV